MTRMDWAFTVLFSGGVLFLIFFVLLFFFMLRTGKELKKTEKCKPKRKSSIKKWRKEKKLLSKKKSRQLTSSILFMVLAIFMLAGAGYARFYEKTNLSEQDIDAVVQGYYLLGEVDSQLAEVTQQQSELTTKQQNNLHTLSVRMASYAANKGSDRMAAEGQFVLNKYYSTLGQLGVNLASENLADISDDQDKLTQYQEDVKRVNTYQKKVLTYFKIDENSLRQKQ